jgi:thiamine pyrophosphokinase
MKMVVVASGDLDPRDAAVLYGADLVIAADGGATALDRLGHTPDRLVGDLDSTDPGLVDRLGAAGTQVERHPTDKDASDAELAVTAAVEAGADETVLLGAMGGGRLDHAVANLLLLADTALAGRDVRLVHGPTTVRVLRGGERVDLVGGAGDIVSLLPIGGDAGGVRTEGLRWTLDGEPLAMGRSRGLSNEVVTAPASVTLEAGTLLVVETATRGASA